MVSLGNPDSSFIIITDSRAAAAMSGKLQFVADAMQRNFEGTDKLTFVGHSVEGTDKADVCRTFFRRS